VLPTHSQVAEDRTRFAGSCLRLGSPFFVNQNQTPLLLFETFFLGCHTQMDEQTSGNKAAS
jgi:hypothetical protein